MTQSSDSSISSSGQNQKESNEEKGMLTPPSSAGSRKASTTGAMKKGRGRKRRVNNAKAVEIVEGSGESGKSVEIHYSTSWKGEGSSRGQSSSASPRRRHNTAPLPLSKDSPFQHVEDMENLKDDFSCALNSSVLIHGRLYVYSDRICFESTIFATLRIIIPISEVRKIKRKKIMLINPAIEIKTLNGKVYEFASFFIPYCDTCYKLCCELFNRYKRTIAAAQVASPTQCNDHLPQLDDEQWEEFEVMEKIVEAELPVSVDRFLDEFMSDTAGYSIADYLTWHEETDISLSEWEKDPPVDVGTLKDDETTLYRTVQYRMKLPETAAFCPSTSRVRKISKLKNCLASSKSAAVQSGSLEPGPCLVLKTSSRSLDVPYGDCFTVEDMWIISECESGREEEDKPVERCRIQIGSQVVFSSWTLWNAPIKSKSVSEMKKFCDDYVAQMRRYLQTKMDSSSDDEQCQLPLSARSMRQVCKQAVGKEVGKQSGCEGLMEIAGQLDVRSPEQLWKGNLGAQDLIVEYTKLHTLLKEHREACKREGCIYSSKEALCGSKVLDDIPLSRIVLACLLVVVLIYAACVFLT